METKEIEIDINIDADISVSSSKKDQKQSVEKSQRSSLSLCGSSLRDVFDPSGGKTSIIEIIVKFPHCFLYYFRKIASIV